MKKSKSLLLMFAFVLVIGTVLAGCGGNNNNANSGTNAAATNAAGNTNTGNATGDEKLAADQTLRVNLTAEPPTFDPAQAQDSQANTVLKTMYEGLTRMNDETGQLSRELPKAGKFLRTVWYIPSNCVMHNGATATL